MIRKGFESVTVVTTVGQTLADIVVERTPDKRALRDASRLGELVTLTKEDIDKVKDNPVSLMPAGQVNQLASHQLFREQGPARTLKWSHSMGRMMPLWHSSQRSQRLLSLKQRQVWNSTGSPISKSP